MWTEICHLQGIFTKKKRLIKEEEKKNGNYQMKAWPGFIYGADRPTPFQFSK